MPNDPYYKTPEWLALRAACLKRDGGKCTVPGCQTPRYRLTADHIGRRRDGGKDTLPNLRTLCGPHHSQIGELPSGERRRAGKPIVRGCDEQGRPLDVGHAWNAKRG